MQYVLCSTCQLPSSSWPCFHITTESNSKELKSRCISAKELGIPVQNRTPCRIFHHGSKRTEAFSPALKCKEEQIWPSNKEGPQKRGVWKGLFLKLWPSLPSYLARIMIPLITYRVNKETLESCTACLWCRRGVALSPKETMSPIQCEEDATPIKYFGFHHYNCSNE